MSFPKILFVMALVFLATAYTEQNHVLILTAEDLPGVTEEFPYILIEFYAPWCGHCKRLAPVYDEVAKELHEAGSEVRLAKIDADEHSSVKGGFGIQGFPTLLFFSKGQQIKYGGGRSKEVIINWLNKKTKPAVTIIEPSQVDELASNGKVNILLHTDESAQHDEAFSAQANLDDYNTYYSVQGSGKDAGTVEVYRPFGEVQSTTFNEDIKTWISKYERPTVYPFDERTISTIFGERGAALILFESESEEQELEEAYNNAAKEIREERGHNLIFTSIDTDAEHYKGLANYIKVIPQKSALVAVDGGRRIKYILEATAADLTAEKIIEFAETWLNGTGHEYKIDEEVVYSDNEKVQEEL